MSRTWAHPAVVIPAGATVLLIVVGVVLMPSSHRASPSAAPSATRDVEPSPAPPPPPTPEPIETKPPPPPVAPAPRKAPVVEEAAPDPGRKLRSAQQRELAAVGAEMKTLEDEASALEAAGKREEAGAKRAALEKLKTRAEALRSAAGEP